MGDVGEEGGEEDAACAGAAFKSRCSRMLTYAHVCSRMLTYADVCSKKRRSEWEKKAHYYAPEDAEALLPEGDDIGPVSHLSRITSAYRYMCLLPQKATTSARYHTSLALLLALLAHTGTCVCCQKAATSARSAILILLYEALSY